MKYLITIALIALAFPVFSQPNILTKVMDSSRNYYSLYEDGTWTKDEPRKKSEAQAEDDLTGETITTAIVVDSITQIVVNGVNINEIDTDYIEIIGVQKGVFKTTVEIIVDFGQQVKSFGGRDQVILKDQNGSNIRLNSMVDALNLFSKFGFVHLQSYVITYGSSNVYHHLLKR